MKVILGVLVGLLLSLGIGYVWGASGRSAAETTAADAQGQLEETDARVRLLEARVSLYNLNFGDASRHLEEAKVPLRRLRVRYEENGRAPAVAAVDGALRHVDEAQQLAGKLDQAANSRAGDAIKALESAAR